MCWLLRNVPGGLSLHVAGKHSPGIAGPVGEAAPVMETARGAEPALGVENAPGVDTAHKCGQACLHQSLVVGLQMHHLLHKSRIM